VQSAENPQEITLLLEGKPRDLTARYTRSVQSRHLRKWCNNNCSILFLFLVLLRMSKKMRVGVWLVY